MIADGGPVTTSAAGPPKGVGTDASAVVGKSLEYRGRVHRYAVFVPSADVAPRPLPVLLFLHGAGEAGVDGWRPVRVGLGPILQRAPERWPFLGVFPQKPPEGGLTWAAHEGLLRAVLDRARADYPTDPARLYGTGISMGAFGLWALAAREPGLFAALAPVCGGGDARWARRLAGVPTWAFHGARDEVVPVSCSRDMVQALREAGGAPRLTVYPDAGHAAWELAYRTADLPAWLLGHRRPADRRRAG